jgi:hypothetical protein
MFLSEMLTTLNGWAKNEAIYKAECENFPGFTNKGNRGDERGSKHAGDDKGKEKSDLIDFAGYIRCLKMWHKNLTKAFCERLESSEGVEVHNALTILSRLLPGEGRDEAVFPIHDTFHKDVKDRVQKMSDDSQHAFGRYTHTHARAHTHTHTRTHTHTHTHTHVCVCVCVYIYI